MITSVTTLKDVEVFAYNLVSEGLTGGFHPDDPFEDYVDDNGQPLYTPAECADRNRLLNQCFEVCERENVDIYEFTGRIMLKDTPFETIFDEDHEEKYMAFMKQVESGEREYKPNRVVNRAVRELTIAAYN